MNIVLLHGSWHGAWCWHKVVPGLQSEGHRVQVPDLPAHGRHWRVARGRTTLASMAAHVSHVLDSLDEPALLVAHSRGGIVASTVAEMRPRKLYGIAYLAACHRDSEACSGFLKVVQVWRCRLHMVEL